jgi:hypothetical protein
MTLEFSRQVSKKFANNKINENPSSGSRGVACGRTDRRTDDKGNSRFSQFGECT